MKGDALQRFFFFFSFFQDSLEICKNPRHIAPAVKISSWIKSWPHCSRFNLLAFLQYASRREGTLTSLTSFPESGIQRHVSAWYFSWCKTSVCKSWLCHSWGQKYKQVYRGLGFHNSHKKPTFHLGFTPEQEKDWWSRLCDVPIQIKYYKMRWLNSAI